MYSLADSVEVSLLSGWNVSMYQEMPSGVSIRCGGIVDTIMGGVQVLVKVLVKEKSRQIEGN